MNLNDGLSYGERVLTIHLAVLIQYRSVTDRRTDGRNCHINIARCVYDWMRTRDRNGH